MVSSFSSRLKTLRIKKGLSQKTLGKMLGLSDKTISAYENGRNTPDFQILVKISKIFGVSVDYLIGATDSEESPTTFKEYPLKDIPVYDEESILANRAIERIKLPTWTECSYGFVVPDDSEEPVLSKGDVALVKRGPAMDGDLILWKGEKLMIRRLYIQRDSVILKPENPDYKPSIEDILKISSSILGVIVGRWQKFK
jgi:repressor LexA